LSKLCEQLLRVLAGVDLVYCASYSPVGADDVSYAARVTCFAVVAGVIGQANLPFGVAKEREGESELFSEGAVFFFGVKADSEYRGVLIGILLDSITESNTFGRSAGGIGFWIKPEHNGLPAQLAQGNVLARMRARGKVGRVISRLQHLNNLLFGIVKTFTRLYLPQRLKATGNRILGVNVIK
jgi:hypothetical protein